MNWLFIISKKSEDLSCIYELLEKVNAVRECLYIEDFTENEIDSGLIKKLNIADYVILNPDTENLHDCNVIYSIGFVAGKKIPSFFGFDGKKFKESKDIFCYPSVEELKNKLEKNLLEYVKMDEQNKAKKALFEKGISFTPDSFSFEILKDNFETVELFYKAGMDVNVRNTDGTPMICISARNKCDEMVEWLLEHGADVDAVSYDRGYSAVMDAVWRSDKDMVECLVNHGANVNIVANDGQSALIIATGSGKQEICEILVKNGADPNFKDHMNMSSLDYATLFKKNELIKLYEEYIK